MSATNDNNTSSSSSDDSDDVFTYDDVFISKRGHHRLSRNIQQLCEDEKQNTEYHAQTQPCLINHCKQRRFAETVVIRTCKNDSQCSNSANGSTFRYQYVHVFGLRRYVHLEFRDQTTAHTFYFQEKIQTIFSVFHEYKLHFVQDMKVVRALPFKHACEGPRTFLKLYVDSKFSAPDLNKLLRSDTNNTLKTLFYPDIHGSHLLQDTQWFIRRNARPSGGRLQLRNYTLKAFEKYDEVYVYYKYVTFLNHETAIPSEHVSVPDIFLHRLKPIVKDVCKAGPPAKLLRMTAETLRAHTFTAEYISYADLKGVFLHKFLASVFSFSNADGLRQHILDKVYHGEERYIQRGMSIDKAMKHTLLTFLTLRFRIHSALKRFWRELLEDYGDSSAASNNLYLNNEIFKQKRWLALDVETDFEPGVAKEETIISVATVTYNLVAANRPKCRVFYKQSLNFESAAYDKQRINCGIQNKIQESIGEKLGHSPPQIDILFSLFENEKSMLNDLFDYICDERISFYCHFNGNMFDNPFLANRWAKLNNQVERLAECRYHTKDVFPDFILSHFKEDSMECFLKQKHRSHSFKTQAKNQYQQLQAQAGASTPANCTQEQRVQRSYRFTDDFGNINDDDDSADDQDYEDDYENAKAQTRDEQHQEFLLRSRQYYTCKMKQAVNVDMWRLCGERTSLNSLAQSDLGISKIEEDEVKYENLKDSWSADNKDIDEMLRLCVLISAYNLLDSLLVMMLTKARLVGEFYNAIAYCSYLTPRDVFIGHQTPMFIALLYQTGYKQNILSVCTNRLRDEEYLWYVGHIFNADTDYEHLRPPAGTTVPDVFGVYKQMIGVFDFASQYPSIHSAYNVCPSTWLSASSAAEQQRLLSTKDRTFYQRTLNNMRPKTVVSKKRKLETLYEEVQMTIHYVNKSVFHGVVPQTVDELKKMRVHYRSVSRDHSVNAENETRTEAERREDKRLANLYDQFQKAVKTLMNAIYGGCMRFYPPVGDTITNFAREQIRTVAKTFQKENGSIVFNSDTDSVFVNLIPLIENNNQPTLDVIQHQLSIATDLYGNASAIFAALIDRAHSMAKRTNEGVGALQPLHPFPCKLEFEKMSAGLINHRKKCYFMYKIEPNLQMKCHVSGMTGKKADKTKMKTFTQFAADKLIQRGDFAGLASLLCDLIFVCQNELSAVRDYYCKLHQLCETVRDSKSSDSYREKLNEAKHFQQSRDVYIEGRKAGTLPIEWFTSRERLNESTKNEAYQRADDDVLLCGGSDKHRLPTFYGVQRSLNVQVMTSIRSLLTIILDCGLSKSLRKFCEAYVVHKYPHKISNIKLKLIFDKIWGCGRDNGDQNDDKEIQRKRTKLDITALPKIYRVHKSQRYVPSDIVVLQLFVISWCIETDQLHQLHNAKLSSSDVGKKLSYYVEEFFEMDPYIQPSLLGHAFPITRTDQLELCRREPLHFVFPSSCSTCDLRLLFNDIHTHHQDATIFYLFSKDNRIHIQTETDVSWSRDNIFQFSYDMSSWSAQNLHVLNNTSTVFTFDITQYHKQTVSSPFITTSVDGKTVYLFNYDSYLLPKENRFAFAVKAVVFKSALQQASGDSVTLASIAHTSDVRLNDACIVADEIIRDDRFSTPCWSYSDKCCIERSKLLKKCQLITNQLSILHIYLPRVRETYVVEVNYTDNLVYLSDPLKSFQYSIPMIVC